jgi:DNA-binding transcriptional ArsR family regulator
VQELTGALGTTQQNVSKHLGVLLQAGLVDRRKLGNYVFYSVADESVFALCDHVCGSLAEQVESLGEIVRR